MTEFSDILRAQIERYPGMQPQDAVKLAFQSEFGGGHLIVDEAACLRYLYEECAATPVDGGAPLYEKIGGGMARVHLAALAVAGVAPATLGRAFLVSARTPQGTREGLERKLSLLEEAAGAGRFVFSAEVLREYLRDYAAAGYPAVSHSAAYRAAYHPAYRVVRLSYARALRLIRRRRPCARTREGSFSPSTAWPQRENRRSLRISPPISGRRNAPSCIWTTSSCRRNCAPRRAMPNRAATSTMSASVRRWWRPFPVQRLPMRGGTRSGCVWPRMHRPAAAGMHRRRLLQHAPLFWRSV